MRLGAGSADLLSGWRLRIRWRASTIAGIAAVLTACGSPGSGPAPSRTPTPSTSGSLSPQVTAVLTAYRAGWAAFTAAAHASDPSLPALDATMVDPLLHAVRAELIRRKYQGSVLEGDVELHPRVTMITGTNATIMDCTYDASQFVYKANGTPVPPATTPQPQGIRATLTEVNGTWKVSDQAKDIQACSAT